MTEINSLFDIKYCITIIEKETSKMIATVRLDKEREDKLSHLAEILHKKKSDILREALDHYAIYILEQKKAKFKLTIDKVKQADLEEYKTYEGTIDDGL